MDEDKDIQLIEREISECQSLLGQGDLNKEHKQFIFNRIIELLNDLKEIKQSKITS